MTGGGGSDGPPADAREATLVLCALPDVGPVTVRRLLDAFGEDPLAVLAAPERRLLGVPNVGPKIAGQIAGWRRHIDLPALRERLARHFAQFILREDDAYPALLRELYDSPRGLYLSGIERPRHRCLAVVGTRHATRYGLDTARSLSRELAAAGYTIVSGLARGIDAAAHRGALEAGGDTVAVLGCGIDLIYPPEHAELYREIRERGAVMSEFPLGRRADRQTFPIRNRLVSGMSMGVLVVESADGGGSLITARFAGEQGRQVFAVPGRIDQGTSAGCHLLIRDGATLVTCARDIVEELEHQEQMEFAMPGAQPAAPIEPPPGLSADESAIFAALRDGAILGADELVDTAGLAYPKVSAALIMLELKQAVVKHADGRYEIARG